MKILKPNPQVNLLKYPKLVQKELVKLGKFFLKHKIEWYVQSSFATNYYGVKKRIVTDIDIRTNYPVKKLFELVKKEYCAKATLRPPIRYGQGKFMEHCIIIPFHKTHIDVFSELTTYNKKDNMTYRLPFDKRYKWVKFHKMKIPLCSLRYLLIYKFINRRGSDEFKNDIGEISQLLAKINN